MPANVTSRRMFLACTLGDVAKLSLGQTPGASETALIRKYPRVIRRGKFKSLRAHATADAPWVSIDCRGENRTVHARVRPCMDYPRTCADDNGDTDRD